jgi:hypothetical protein
MQNPSTDDKHSAYYDAVSRADADLEDALSHVRAEEEAHRITTAKAAAERIELLEHHLELCQQARLDHLGGTP